MKTTSVFLAALLGAAQLTASAPSAMAQVNEVSESTATTPKASDKLSVIQVKPMQFRVLFNNPQSQKISVRIVDSQDNVLFSELNTVKSNYTKYFDLSPLLDGTYTFQIVDGKEEYSQSFDIMTQTRRVVSSLN